MPLNPLYVVASDIEQFYVDKDTGLPLSNGTLTFYRDSARNVPKQVFQLSGFPPNYTYTSMGVQITLSAVGTVQNSGGDNEVIYYFPYDADGNIDLYYIVVADQNGVVQFTREAWPNITQTVNPVIDEFPTQNQFANPQFTEVFINDGFSTIYNVTSATNQVFTFAPDWDFLISGTGSVTVQRIPVTGNDKIITSPPYVLDVSLTGGITACKMRQRFNINSGLWASTSTNPLFLSGTMIAKNQNNGTTGIQMFYLESSGGSPINIIDATFDNSGYVLLNGVTTDPIPLSNDTNSGANGYVDVYVSFLSGSNVRISSLQVVPTPVQSSGDFLQYSLNSSNREEALLGDFYLPALKARPTPSLLVGWDFMVNPFQFGTGDPIDTPPDYICDQTIAGRTAGAASFSRSPATEGLEIITTAANNAVYILQYLQGDDARKILGTPLSVNLFAYSSADKDPVTVRVYLFRAPTAATIPIIPAVLGNIAIDGTFTLTQAGWTEIPRGGLDTAKAILPQLATFDNVNNTANDTGFSGWELTDASQISDTEKLAIVVTFSYPDASTNIVINSVSLTPGRVPCRPAPLTFSQVLAQCQYYYEKTYDPFFLVGAITPIGSRMFYQKAAEAGILFAAYPRFWSDAYKVPKRIAITPSIYSPATGAVNQVSVIIYDNTTTIVTEDSPITAWTLIDNSTTGFSYQANARSTPIAFFGGSPTLLGAEAVINYHRVADARLGIIT